MARKYSKILFLGLLLVCFMSVTVAADLTEDTATDTVEVTNNVQLDDTIYEVESDEDEDNSDYTCPVNPTNTVNVSDNANFTIQNNTKFDFSGTFTNKTYNFDNLDTVVFTSTNNDAIFYNSTFTLNGQSIKISNLTFYNTNTNGNPITINATTTACIVNNTINVYKNVSEETFAINVINSNDVRVADNFINETGVPQMMGWETGVGTIKFSGIVFNDVDSSNISNNELYLQNCSAAYPFGYSTMEAITVKGGSQGDNILQNNITITGSEYIYAISLSELDNNIQVEDNNIYLSGSNYICGIQFSSVTNSAARRNIIKGNCTSTSGSGASYEAFAYGIVVLTGTWGASSSEATGNTLESNNVTLNSTVAYAYELSNADYTTITNNNATVYGNVVMALGIYNSSYGGITGNIFTVTGNTTDLDSRIYEAIPPETTGVKIVDSGSYNNSISSNIITVNDSSILYYTIIIEDAVNTTVISNTLTSGIGTGNSTVLDEGVNSNIGSNP